MPFDAATMQVDTLQRTKPKYALPPPHTLKECLARMGITPVPMKVLEAHKRAQIRANPPSLILRPRLYAGLFLLESAGWFLWGLDTSELTRADLVISSILAAMFYGFFTTGISWFLIRFMGDLSGARILGKARWQEHRWIAGDVPYPLRDMLYAVQAEAPRTRIQYGELIQNKVILDPYAIVEWRTTGADNTVHIERHCLGIWEGDEIIALADRQD